MKKVNKFIGLLTVITICIFISPSNSVTHIKNKIAQNLMTEFKSYIQKKPTYYNLVMASSKANGILGIYKTYFKPDEILWVSEKYEKIKEDLVFSTVYFGYYNSGLYFIALAQPQMSHNFDFKDTMDQIKGFQGETNFLSELFYLPNSYYALDIYVVDLFKKRKALNINIFISEDNVSQAPLKNPEDKELNSLLKKYKRDYRNIGTIENGTWKLYLFKKSVGYPSIKITCEGEKVLLTN